MRPATFARPAALAASRIPGLRRLPVLKLVAVAEIAILAREHVVRLDPQERRRVIHLVRVGRIRRHLSEEERDELATLVAKMKPRLFLGHVVNKLSPVPLPRRVVYGSDRDDSKRGRRN